MGHDTRTTGATDAQKSRRPKLRRLAKLVRTIVSKTPPIAKLTANKKVRAGIAIVAGTALVLLLGWWGWSHSSLSKLSVNAALIDGTAEFRLDDADPWERVQKGMSFGEGAQLRTRADSRLGLRIADGSEVRLNSDSSVRLSKLTAGQIIIQSAGGELYARASDKKSRTFQIRTGTTTYQAVGITAYRVFDSREKQGVETYFSGVSIPGSESTPITIWQGKRYFIRNAADKNTEGKITDLVQADLAGSDFLHWNRNLDEQRFAALLGALDDITPPDLTITEPTDGTRTTEEGIVVSGTTEKYAAISINGVAMINNNRIFGSRINLEIGENLITVEATDEAGNKTTRTLKVIRNQPTDFQLSGVRTTPGISLSWNINGIETGKGFQIIMGDYEDPTLSIKTQNVLVDPSKRSYTWPIADGKPHYFRICTYDGERCTDYSNDVAVIAAHEPQ